MTLSLPHQRIQWAGRGPSFWLPINLWDLRLLPRPKWIEDLSINWEPGFTAPPQTKIFAFHTPSKALFSSHGEGEEVLEVTPRFGETGIPVDWATRGGCAGLYLNTLEYISVVHHFYPSLLFASLTLDGIRSTEPYRKEWEKPKSAMTAAERQRWGL